ncbi:MAG: hypothetical protein H6736_15935 [Alphaproteobacteria bacterium]|nr:hypothetical protein [Alphaproteobacteria bacterium]MCB9693302.1 hypothetical protein [Alphaproteobacteria bacterium]
MIWMLAGLALAQDPGAEPAEAPPEETPAATDGPSEADLAEAARLYEAGVKMYDEALYAQAIEAFQKSYDLSGEPALLFNIANAQEREGDVEGTIATLNRYRIYAPAGEAESLDRRVRTLETRLLEQKRKDAEAAAAKNVQPTGPQMVERTNGTKWALVGAGTGGAVVFGVVAGLAYVEGQDAIDAGDKALYGTPRTLNNISLALAAVGIGMAGVGLTLPSKRQVPAVGLDLRRDAAHVGLTWTY